MRVKFGFVLSAFAMATVWIAPIATADDDPSKFNWVCHIKGNGEYNLLVTGLNATERHAATHGDWIGAYTPGVPPDCSSTW